MSQQVIDQLIINSPFTEPLRYWRYNRETQGFDLVEGRRPAGYVRASREAAKRFDDPGEFIEIELVNKIRPRVAKWKAAGYPNVTGTTKKLLEFWQNTDVRERQPFWCQMEAVETAIWLTEGSEAEKQGIEIPSDGDWIRQCLKLATGTGKTVVMAMLITWQALNKIANPRDQRFSKNILVVAPGLTVRDRLQVLLPENPDNFFEDFNVVPPALWQELLQAKIIVTNWHVLAPNDNPGPKVMKLGAESDEAFVRNRFPEFGGATNILVINDEAHHCHRPTNDEDKDEQEQATIWVDGLDRIHRARGILRAYDLSATPFKPTGHGNQGEMLFGWIVSDFGLNDAIEAGLVKTPKVAVRDDSSMSKDFKSRLFHIYPEIKDDLNRRAEPHEGLPDLLVNAVNILGGDWLKTKEEWDSFDRGTKVPPVIIMISNRTETAARLEYFLTQGYTVVDELRDASRLIRIDQDAFDKLEADESSEISGKKKDLIAAQRERFNTVGKDGKPGEQVQCVIGVNMLSEGWDARTVTHILGVRAFTSQLLCEQVVGRGLRRISYDINETTGLFDPEYVTVFGVPFTFLPVEGSGTTVPRVEKPKTKIEPVPERTELEIKWPHVLRVDYKLSYFLEVNWDEVDTLTLSAEDAPLVVEVAPVIEGKPDFTQLSAINLERLSDAHRLQSTKTRAIVQLIEKLKSNWSGALGDQFSQLSKIIDRFLESDRLQILIPDFSGSDQLRQIVIALNMQRIVNHLESVIKQSSKEQPLAIFDSVRPMRSTATAPTWYTTKPTQPVQKSQISHIVMDSRWEGIGLEFERQRIPGLVSWAKNDHLGFEILYVWRGQNHTYYPDFLVKFNDGRHLIIEVKGQKTTQDDVKWRAAREWVDAVNTDGNFGTWEFKTLEDPKDIYKLLR